MELNEIIAEVNAGFPNMSEEEIIDELGAMVWTIGRLWDQVAGVDSEKGGSARYGTPNRQSMTYKLRRAAGYSYP